jgi:macro domain-containing protein
VIKRKGSMKETKGNLFDLMLHDGVDGIGILTNQNYTLDGRACMSGGCAKECADRFPQTSFRLAKCLKNFGTNVPFVIGAVDVEGKYLEPNHKMIKGKQFKSLIFSFPTINDLMVGASLELIKNSSQEMVNMANRYDLAGIVVPRMGCGIGGLSWTDVKQVVEPILDNRFTIVSFAHESD